MVKERLSKLLRTSLTEWYILPTDDPISRLPTAHRTLLWLSYCHDDDEIQIEIPISWTFDMKLSRRVISAERRALKYMSIYQGIYISKIHFTNHILVLAALTGNYEFAVKKLFVFRRLLLQDWSYSNKTDVYDVCSSLQIASFYEGFLRRS